VLKTKDNPNPDPEIVSFPQTEICMAIALCLLKRILIPGKKNVSFSVLYLYFHV